MEVSFCLPILYIFFVNNASPILILTLGNPRLPRLVGCYVTQWVLIAVCIIALKKVKNVS
jgi:hypothetical protein